MEPRFSRQGTPDRERRPSHQAVEVREKRRFSGILPPKQAEPENTSAKLVAAEVAEEVSKALESQLARLAQDVVQCVEKSIMLLNAPTGPSSSLEDGAQDSSRNTMAMQVSDFSKCDSQKKENIISFITAAANSPVASQHSADELRFSQLPRPPLGSESDAPAPSEDFRPTMSSSQTSLRKKSTLRGTRRRQTLEGGQLAADWPSCLLLRFEYADDAPVAGDGSGKDITDAMERRASMDSLRVTQRVSAKGKQLTTMPSKKSTGQRKCRTLDPNSTFVSAMDMLGFVVLMWDLVMSPAILAWDIVVKGGPVFAIMFMAACYWLFQLILNFGIGFYRYGDLVSKPREVVSNYLKTWFCIDLMICTLDWSALLIAVSGDGVDTGSQEQAIVRIFRMAQVAKVFRLSRLGRLMERTSAWSLSEGSRVALQAAKMIVSILIASHLLCCIWFIIGKHAPSDTGTRWPDVPGPDLGDEVPFLDYDGAFQYITALHWITAQVTLASCYVVPRSSFEGVVSVALLVYGLLFSGTIVSILSAHTVQLVMMRQEQTKKLVTLRRYLRERSVNPILAARIQTQAVHRLSQEVPLKEEDVPALRDLSLPLQQWLLKETRQPHLTTHALFRIWWNLEETAVELLCETVESEFYSPQDVLFVPAKSSEYMFLVVDGSFRYSQEPTTSKVLDAYEQDVDAGAWVCEAALWSDWTHVGKLEAETQVKVFKLSYEELASILEVLKMVSMVTRSYARSFYLRLTTACPPHSDWPTDLGLPFTSAADLLSKDVGVGLLRAACTSGRISLMPAESAQLEDEIRHETCALQQTERGELERLVAVHCINITRPNGDILVHLGSYHADRGLIDACCKLPGHKRPHGELPKAALERLLATPALSHFSTGIKLLHVEHDVQVKEDRFPGIRSKYLRTVQQCLLQPGFEPDLPVASANGALSRQFDSFAVLTIPINEDTAGLYCWMSQTTFEFASSPNGLKLLQGWLAGVTVDFAAIRRRGSLHKQPQLLDKWKETELIL